MILYKALDNDRLDKIVYRHYGHLRFFERVLEVNSHLKTKLKAGDEVKLPKFKDVVVIKDNTLW